MTRAKSKLAVCTATVERVEALVEEAGARAFTASDLPGLYAIFGEFTVMLVRGQAEIRSAIRYCNPKEDNAFLDLSSRLGTSNRIMYRLILDSMDFNDEPWG